MVYRLGLRALPVPGMVESTNVGSVAVEFVVGPMRVQRTIIRQRHGLPVHFDKVMTRLDIGRNELIALLSTRESPALQISLELSLDGGAGPWRRPAC